VSVMIIDMFTGILAASWQVFSRSAPYVLFGLALAGVIRGLLPDTFVSRHMGGKGVGSVVKAALLGVPLPICSCGVIPVAMGLRKQGAGNGATTAFLISTPETGVDSISITYALLDPIMTIIRPVSAFITALTAGILVNFLPDRPPARSTAPDPVTTPCTCPAEPSGTCACTGHLPGSRLSRVKKGLAFSFTDLLGDIGTILIIGCIIAGAITWSIPDDFIHRYLGGGVLPMLIMLVAGIPLYVCATATTPVVAALALKGLSPGAALVFMLTGPATNATTITVIAGTMGRRVAAVYTATIAAVALVLGFAVNLLYEALSLNISDWVVAGEEHGARLIAGICATVLLMLIARAHWRRTH
jgi:uncharacterized protein